MRPYAVMSTRRNSICMCRTETLVLQREVTCMACMMGFSPEDSVENVCRNKHNMCRECAKRSFEVLVKEKTLSGLLCGCLSIEDMDKLRDFAGALSLKHLKRVEEWMDDLLMDLTKRCLLPCAVNTCGIENWPLLGEVSSSWTCRAGHRNMIKICENDVEAFNSELAQLYVAERTSYSTIDKGEIPIYRACPMCAAEGNMTLCQRSSGCKQFPGDDSERMALKHVACTHKFCFRCLRDWRRCDHKVACENPGVQVLSSAGTSGLDVTFVPSHVFTPPPPQNLGVPDDEAACSEPVEGACRE
jgi:hypothetical protein